MKSLLYTRERKVSHPAVCPRRILDSAEALRGWKGRGLYPERLFFAEWIQKLWDCGFESGGFGCVFGIFREDDCLNGEGLYPER